jgi:hypothetical protein
LKRRLGVAWPGAPALKRQLNGHSTSLPPKAARQESLGC